MTQTRSRRSVLYVPATNTKAMSKVASLDCDAIIFDLEDAVAPEAKGEGRQNLIDFFAVNQPPASQEWVIRINTTPGGLSPEDVDTVVACKPHAMLLPKLENTDMLAAARDMLTERTDAMIRLWAMIETPRGIVDLRPLSSFGASAAIGLDCFVAGTNDIAKETGLPLPEGRKTMEHWLASLVLHGRAFGIDVVDGVYNDFRNEEGFSAECRSGALLGFDGKTLIHPAQITPANAAFSPSEAAVAEAKAVIEAFAQPENAGKGVISINGKMVELLHLHIARKVLAKARVEG
ncbi:HpcH/HpaI aldolase/citrate lyase family protein [Tianweitania sediminis]|uniref:CoA ester lyase n=1 Tax=Tianweitania sediminis TaxID=1502156 RepID=A0A8J7UIL2_9HYPH|nr:CoA ester lyase [Tianweitania sediminis]MBP0440344.1 CoA ester lyase [Tianweitania sediminis]